MPEEMHVSDFPPDDDGDYASRGWDGQVNIVEDLATGELIHVDHAERDPEPAVTEAEGDESEE